MRKFLVVLLMAASVASSSCKMTHHDTETNNVPPSSREAKNFKAVEVSSAINLYLEQGDEEAVSIKTPTEELGKKVKTKVEDGVLKIYMEDGFSWNMGNEGPVKVFVTYKSLEKIEASGACSVKAKAIAANSLRVELSGASSFAGNIDVTTLDLDVSGASSIKIKGSATNTKIEASGACNIKGYGFKTSYCKVDAGGASNLQIWVTKELSGDASGGSTINYKGEATTNSLETSGGANVHKSEGGD